MLQAVLFDDEYIVLKGLQKMIDWSHYDVKLAGTATDGLAALELYRKVRPDIVLTDIRMPGMDGLQLIEHIMQETPETYCVVFSGYNEFEYAKRAIQLGVADYLEKPITIESIEKALRKMTQRIGQRLSREQALLEKATLDLLLSGEAAAASWRTTIGKQTAERVVATTILISSGDMTLSEDESYRVVNVWTGQERCHAVFHFQRPTYEFWERVEQSAERFAVTIGAGDTVSGFGGAGSSYQEAKRAYRAARFLGERLVRSEELGETFTVSGDLSDREEAILWHLRTGSRSELKREIDNLIFQFQTNKFAPETVESEMLKLIYLAQEAAEKLGAGNRTQLTGREASHVDIRRAANEGKLEAWFRSQMDQIARWIEESRDEKKHEAIERAVRYIERNINQDLSLQKVAEHVGMNAAYLSVLFKDAMGETYIHFVTRKRVERAKQLLAQGLKVQEVSERVGYYTYRHFSEIFKKHTGLTPGQFRDGNR